MDAVDRKLLDALRGNARATYAELARTVGLSAPAAHERVAKLEAAGVITGFHAAVKPEAVGFGTTPLIGLFITDSADIHVITTPPGALPRVGGCWVVAGEGKVVVKGRGTALPALGGGI